MAFVESIVLEDTEIEHPSLSVVKDSIVRLAKTPHVTLYFGGTGGQVVMEFVSGMGYYISAFGKGEIEEWLACEESLPTELVGVEIAGLSANVPRRILVSQRMAQEVASVFYQDGSRSSSHCWVRSLDLM